MRIKRSSWRYRIYTCYFGAPDLGISVCGFWSRMIILVPVISFFLMFLIPILWCGDKVEKWKNKRGGFCPFGKVEFDGEVSGDKAYASVRNFETVVSAGGVPFVPFREDHSGRKGGLWQKLFHFFMYERETFLTHYHKRSNAESTFSMMKRKFGDSLRSRTDTAMINEALCKVLCHNLVVLIHEMHELGIEPKFWREC